MKRARRIGIASWVALWLAAATQIQAATPVPVTLASNSPQAVALAMAMRELWSEHMFWQRASLVSVLNNLADAPKISDRLLANQNDIGTAIKPFFGEAAGNRLADLLKNHITIGTRVFQAAKAKDQAKSAAASKEWNQNADAIAAFLGKTNPKWQQAQMADMLHNHLRLLSEQMNAHLKYDWNGEIAYADQNTDLMLKLADALSNGIFLQVPDKFK